LIDRAKQKLVAAPPGTIENSPPEADFQPRNLFLGKDKTRNTIVPSERLKNND